MATILVLRLTAAYKLPIDVGILNDRSAHMDKRFRMVSKTQVFRNMLASELKTCRDELQLLDGNKSLDAFMRRMEIAKTCRSLEERIRMYSIAASVCGRS